MLIFNTTYIVSTSIEHAWIAFIKKNHIPFMTNESVFSNPQIAKIVGSTPDDGVSYSVQFQISDMDTLTKWHKSNAEEFQLSFQNAFANEVHFFSTVLEIIE